ncbi:Olfactory receptor 13H1 [Tupaia chinensis]|uniref:Olfactory receptor n=1 Tax=Tupaia chinensis TaxID=246437 RepID=L8YAA2_TUPCH|nr:Olfactory receptor 13H1 [Tupaia chinensis]
MECFLLAIMAYDRFLAISKPLHYPLIMNNNVCIWMVVGVWASAFLMAVIPVLVTPIHFCGHNVVNHFTCELQVLFKLSCSHILVKEILMFASGVLVLFLPFGFIVLSYFRIAVAVLRIHSVEARLKAFSTCGSHLTVVIIYYGTAMFMYMRPHSQSSQDEDKIISVLYGVVTPMLNPLIYTLRNKDVKDALKKVVKGKKLV